MQGSYRGAQDCRNVAVPTHSRSTSHLALNLDISLKTSAVGILSVIAFNNISTRFWCKLLKPNFLLTGCRLRCSPVRS